MPIRPEHRAFYASPEWAAIRARILARAGNKCEHCGRPNRRITDVIDGGFWRLNRLSHWRNGEGKKADPPRGLSIERKRGQVGVAHLDHDVANNDDANLAALCQRCHLVHDTHQHHANARRTRAERSGQAWILPEMEARV